MCVCVWLLEREKGIRAEGGGLHHVRVWPLKYISMHLYMSCEH